MSAIFRQQDHWLRRSIFLICLLVAFCNPSFAQNRRLYNSRYTVLATAFSPDGKTLAISRGTGDPQLRHGQVDIWDVETKKLLHIIKGFDGPVWSVIFLSDNRTLVSGSAEFRASKLKGGPQDGKFYTEIKWWDVETGELKHRQTNQTQEQRTLINTVSSDGRWLANVEYYTEVSTGYSSSVDLSNPNNTPGPMQRYTSRTNIVNLNLLNARTGVANGESKKILSSNLPMFRGPFFSPPVPGGAFGSEGAIFSPVGNLIAVGTSDQVKVYDTETGAQLLKLKKFKGQARAVRFSPDGQVLAVASVITDRKRSDKFDTFTFKSELNFYDARSGQVIKTLTKDGSVFYFSFTPDSAGLLIGINDYVENKPRNGLKYLDLQTGKFSDILNKQGMARSFTLSPDGQSMAYVNGLSVAVWDIKTQRLKHTFDEIKEDEDPKNTDSRYILDVNRVLSISFSSDGKTLAAGTEKNEIKLWDPRTGALKTKLSGHEGPVSGLALSADGQKLVSSSDDQTARIWDAGSGTQKGLLMDGSNIVSVTLSPDGKSIAGGSESDVLLWEAQTGQLRKTFPSEDRARINSVIFSPDGQLLVSVNDDGLVQVRNAETGEVKKSFNTRDKITTAVLSADGRLLASATADGEINVWNVQTGALIKNLKKDDSPVNALAFSADGRFLASGGDNRKVVIWETARWDDEHTLKGVDLTVTSLAFSPDGEFLAGGSGNVSVILWNVKTGKLDRILK